MHTPDNARGRETDRRMFQWRKANPNATNSEYNREWERTYESLNEEDCRRWESTMLYDESIIHEEKRQQYQALREEDAWKRPLPKYIYKKPKNKTKGAFGKSKHQK